MSGQTPHWPQRAVTIAILIAAIFYALDLAAWNAGILRTKLGNATLFGNTGSIVFAVYGLSSPSARRRRARSTALLLAVGGRRLADERKL